MLEKFYYWFHKKISRPEERDQYSGGYWQDRVRQEALILCRGIRGKVLEVGCGEGLFLTQLATENSELEILGVDKNSSLLDEAEQRIKKANLKNIILSQQDAANLSFEDEYFDAVICINVLFNLDSFDSVKQVLNQIKRVCKKSGKIIIDFRNSANPVLRMKYKSARFYDRTLKNLPLNTYYLEQIEGILRNLSIDIINKRYIGFFIKRFAPLIIIAAERRC